MRSNRTSAVFYDDILTSIEKLEGYTAGVSFEQFEQDSEKQDAVLRRLLVLTEASHRLRPEELLLCPEPDWRRICDLGNVIRHQYDGIELNVIWNIVHIELQPLKVAVERTFREHFPHIVRS